MTEFTHIDEKGRARMVDVTPKHVTHRLARASVCLNMQPSTLTRIIEGGMNKGDVFAAARIAGIMAAKRVDELIPLCHQLPLGSVSVDFEPAAGRGVLKIIVTARAEAKTGVEMEALTAASIAALTVYDMCKAVDREMTIDALKLEEKSGGKSDYKR